jgi:hypothetical protein
VASITICHPWLLQRSSTVPAFLDAGFRQPMILPLTCCFAPCYAVLQDKVRKATAEQLKVELR